MIGKLRSTIAPQTRLMRRLISRRPAAAPALTPRKALRKVSVSVLLLVGTWLGVRFLVGYVANPRQLMPYLAASGYALVQWDDHYLFCGDDGVWGRELWCLEASGDVHLVADICPHGDARPDSITDCGAFACFSASDGVHGTELWQWDGRQAPTMVADLNPQGNSDPRDLVFSAERAELLFSAEDQTGDRKFWRYRRGERRRMIEGDYSVTAGVGLYRRSSDVDDPNTEEARQKCICAVGDKVYFCARDNETSCDALWVCGEESSAKPVVGIGDQGDSDPLRLTACHGSLYFVAGDEQHGRELWRLDAAGEPRMVADIHPGPADSNPADLTVSGGTLYFTASLGHPKGRQLWQCDGRSPPRMLTSKGWCQHPMDLVPYCAGLLFLAAERRGTTSLWRYDPATEIDIVGGEDLTWYTVCGDHVVLASRESDSLVCQSIGERTRGAVEFHSIRTASRRHYSSSRGPLGSVALFFSSAYTGLLGKIPFSAGSVLRELPVECTSLWVYDPARPTIKYCWGTRIIGLLILVWMVFDIVLVARKARLPKVHGLAESVNIGIPVSLVGAAAAALPALVLLLATVAGPWDWCLGAMLVLGAWKPLFALWMTAAAMGGNTALLTYLFRNRSWAVCAMAFLFAVVCNECLLTVGFDENPALANEWRFFVFWAVVGGYSAAVGQIIGTWRDRTAARRGDPLWSTSGSRQ